MALIVIASILLVVSVFAVWAKRQLLETETWTETSTELLADAEIQDALADFLVTELYDNVDVEGELASRLPPQVKPLAGPVSGGLRQLADQVARKALAQPKVQGLWEDANRTAHTQFLAIVDDDAGAALSTSDGTVTLDLSSIVGQVTAQLGISADLASKLPANVAQLEIVKSDELEAAQTAVSLLRTLAWVLAAIALVLYGVAILVAGDRRRQTLRAGGFSLIVVGALVLLLHRVGGDAVVESLSDVASTDGAVDSAWTIGTSQLTEIAEALILYGIFIVIAAWLAGPTSIATSIRAAITPWLRRPAYAYGGLAVALVLLFWWDPTEGTHRLIPSLVLIALLALGTELLRRQVIREFPDRVATGSGEGIAQALAERMREAREARVGATSSSTATVPAPPTGESRVDELERLSRLRDADALTAEEYEAEKRRVLGGG